MGMYIPFCIFPPVQYLNLATRRSILGFIVLCKYYITLVKSHKQYHQMVVFSIAMNNLKPPGSLKKPLSLYQSEESKAVPPYVGSGMRAVYTHDVVDSIRKKSQRVLSFCRIRMGRQSLQAATRLRENKQLLF